MKKGFKKIIICIMALSLCFLITGCKGNKEKTQTNIGDFNKEVIETDSRIARQTTTPISLLQEKTFTITDNESGDIGVLIEPKSGSIDVEIVDGMGRILLKLDEEMVIPGEENLINVDEGNGTYTITVEMTDYVGKFDIMWDIMNIEEIIKYTSEQGYELEYDNKKMLSKGLIDGYDYFVSRAKDESNPEDENVSFRAKVVSATDAEATKTALKSDEEARIGDCILAKGTLKGFYVEREEDVDGERLRKMTFCVDLSDGGIMVIETSAYNEYSEKSSSMNRIDKMLDSIVISK